MGIRISSSWQKYSSKTEAILLVCGATATVAGVVVSLVISASSTTSLPIFLGPPGILIGAGLRSFIEFLKSHNSDRVTDDSKRMMLSVLVFPEYALALWALFSIIVTIVTLSGG